MSDIVNLLSNTVRKGLDELQRSGVGYNNGECTDEAVKDDYCIQYHIDGAEYQIIVRKVEGGPT